MRMSPLGREFYETASLCGADGSGIVEGGDEEERPLGTGYRNEAGGR
ncbi:MAG: hypothetical protein L5656_00800 [Thermanaeromonas sp.]|nr:hypothetical protein [Thermanaeromonas sp.]